MKTKVFKISNEIIDVLLSFKKLKPYKGSHAIKHDKFKSMLNTLSSYYNVPEPFLYVTDRSLPRTSLDVKLKKDKGIYFSGTMLIALRKFSVISALHEFRHHLQYEKKNIVLVSTDCEDDANEWSHFIYRTVWSSNYKKLKEKNELNKTSVKVI